MIKRVLILLSYVLGGIGIIAATIIIVAFGQGYNYNIRTNTFSIDGFLVLATDPTGARVTIDGKTLRRKTPYRDTASAGLHDVTLTRDGYRTWSKRLQVLATGVTTWGDILLIPNELKPFSVTSGKAVTNLIATRDRKRFAFITSGSEPGLWVLSGDRRQSQKVYTPAAATPDKPAEVIESASWAEDGSHLLLRVKAGDTTSYIVVPSGGGQAVNLTELFKFDLSSLQFSPNDWRELYWISPEGLRKLNVEAKTVSAVLADKVLGYTFVGNDRMVFVQKTTSGNILASSDRSGNNVRRLVEAIAESPSYQVAYSLYRSHDYVTVLPSATGTATVYGDIFTPNPTAKVISQTAKAIITSDTGRFVGFTHSEGFGVYDLDEDLVYSTKSTEITGLAWFDESHLLVNHKGQGAIVEYDGGNMVDLLSCSGIPFGSNDKKQVVCLAPAGDPNTDISAVEIKR